MPRKFSLLLYGLVLLWLGVSAACLWIPPYTWWPAGFIAMTLPVPLLLNLGFLLLWLFRRKWAALVPLVMFMLCLSLYGRGMQHGLGGSSNPEKLAGSFQLMSYNVRVFNIYPHLQPSADKHETHDLLKFVVEQPGDIMALQEYFNGSLSKNLNATEAIRKKWPHYYKSITGKNTVDDEFGMAIFSRHPVVGKGQIRFKNLTSNHAMYADIKIGSDTVRVYNYHLQSMSIDENNLPVARDGQRQFKTKFLDLFYRLRRGMVIRSRQVRQLREHIDSSPYPAIAVGDLNDIPYSSTYHYMRRTLRNAFEDAGFGLGITYAGRLPMLRIDNHFFSDGLKALEFETLEEVKHTDHYPTVARYRFER